MSALGSYMHTKLTNSGKARASLSEMVWTFVGMYTAVLALGVLNMHAKTWPVVGQWHQQVGVRQLQVPHAPWLGSHAAPVFRPPQSARPTSPQYAHMRACQPTPGRSPAPPRAHPSATHLTSLDEPGTRGTPPSSLRAVRQALHATRCHRRGCSGSSSDSGGMHAPVPPTRPTHTQGLGLLLGSFGTLCVLIFGKPEVEAVRLW